MHITYTYKQCEKQELEKNADFREELFDAKLIKLESTSVTVERVDVVFEMNGHHEFHTQIEVHIPGPNIKVIEKGQGEEPSKIVHAAINSAIDIFRKHKEEVKD